MFRPVINDPCEICGLIFRLEFLKCVRCIDGIFLYVQIALKKFSRLMVVVL